MITLDELQRILDECAGEDEDIQVAGDILDIPFTSLGYDSLALLEAAAQVKQLYGVELTDEMVGSLQTPRDFLAGVNRQVQQQAA